MGEWTIWYGIRRFFIELTARLLPRSVVGECFSLFAERRIGSGDYWNTTWIDLWNMPEQDDAATKDGK